MGVIARLGRWYHGLLAACGMLAGAMIALVALLVTLDVLLRNTGLGTLPWLIEVVEYALYLSAFVAAPWVLSLGGHVRVDLLVNALPAAATRWLEVAIDLVGCLISATLFSCSLDATLDAHAIGSLIIKQLIVPEWWLLAVMPATSLLLALEFLRRAARASRHRPADERAMPRDGL